jgi:general secretion pathway protein I
MAPEAARAGGGKCRQVWRAGPRPGFTLLEIMIALAVFAVTAAALGAAVSRHVAQSGVLADRTIAQWIAENELNQLRIAGEPGPDADRRPATGTLRREVRMANRDWQVEVAVRATDNDDIRRVVVSVFRAQEDRARAAVLELVGFIGRY